MSDDYEPVTLTGGSEPPPAPEAPPERVGGPLGDLEESQPRGQRVLSDNTRKLFQQLVALHADGIDPTDDLVPVDTTTPAAAATPAPPPESPPTTVPVAAAPIPAVELPAAAADVAARAIEQQRAVLAEQREKALAARETALEAERAKLPTREAFIDKPAATVRDLVKQWTGADTDAEIKDAIADLISELTAESLGAPLDERLRTGIESRKALRAVKSYKGDLQRQQEAAKAEALKADEARKAEVAAADAKQRTASAQTVLHGLLTTDAAKYPWLMANDDEAAPHLVVWSVLESQRDEFVKKHGDSAITHFKADWPAAAKLADDYYKTKADKAIKRYQPLLAPAAPVAPAVKPSPQVSAQVQRSTTQPVTPQPDSPPEPESSDWRAERQARRRQSLEKNFSKATTD